MQQKSRSSTDFLTAFSTLISNARLGSIFRCHGPAKRSPAKVQASCIVRALVFHLLRGMGTLSENLQLLHQETLCPSSMSERRANLPWKVFQTIMETALRPQAREEKHPMAFYKHWLLVAIDGTQFSVTNTPQILSSLSKATSRRMKAAFAKVGLAVLVELGVHNPLAAEIGQNGESEMALSKRLLGRLPAKSLLICDRYYGVGAFLGLLVERFQEISGAFLLRVRSNLAPTVIKRLSDGSALVSVKLGKGKKATLVREIRGRVRRKSGRWVDVRFWTNLLDIRQYRAKELLGLYAKRWEQELMYRQLKVDMRQSPVLNSHTVHTAAQEVAALVLAHAVVARSRIEAASEAGSEVVRISFGKTLAMVRSLWLVLAAGNGIISGKQAAALTERVMAYLADAILPERRKRSCPRKVRQPVSKWPRLTENSYEIGEIEYEILNAYA
jgi:hypothetical protein